MNLTNQQMEEKIGRKISRYEKLLFIGTDLEQWELLDGKWTRTDPILPEKYVRIKEEKDMGHRIYVRENGTDRLLDSTFFIYRSDCVLWAERLAKANKLEFVQ